MQWRRACENSACVEVAVEAGAVLIRDSKQPDTVLRFTPGEWREFVAGIKAGTCGEFS